MRHECWTVVWLIWLVLCCDSQARNRISLTGSWERRLGSQPHDVIDVPSSYRPLGVATLRRTVELSALKQHERVILRFEGITHQGIARFNRKEIGRMGPWTPYEFDITNQILPGANQVEVEIADWQVPLGPGAGWEVYGGIIRDVYLEVRSDPYIENAHLQCALNSTMDEARCALDVSLSSTVPSQAKLTTELLQGSAAVRRVVKDVDLVGGLSVIPVTFDVGGPVLWSPELPNLYTLKIKLESSNRADLFSAETGIRDLRIRGNKFFLNGQPLVLRGVCRHDIWENQGHTLTQAQIEQDMRMIKAMGANFVRLVHYPHDRRVVEVAGRIGLLVTEESGLVWVDFRKISRETIEAGLQNLERTVRRDWNNPALFAVLLANESAPTVEVTQEACKRIRTLAPNLFLSTARADSPEVSDFVGSKRIFDDGGLDFYTYHPYDFDAGVFEKTVLGLPGKPLVLTEWGGRAVGQSPALMKESSDEIGRLVESGRLAGHSYWSWSDLPEFSRGGTEMEKGILTSGVVTENRIPRPDVYLSLASLFRRVPATPSDPATEPQWLAPKTVPLSIDSRFSTISLQPLLVSPGQTKAWAELETLMERFWSSHRFTRRHWSQTGGSFWLWNSPKLSIGKIPFETAVRTGKSRPILLTPSQHRVEVSVNLQADRLHFLGNVTLPDGYPVIGRFGEQVARYLIVYADGEQQEAPLRWGQEIARSNMIAVASRIDPSTSFGERVMSYVKEPTREIYQTRLLSVDTKPKMIVRLVCELQGSSSPAIGPPPDMHHAVGPPLSPGGQAVVLFAMTAERRDPR